MTTPRLSICMPTYNFGKFIGETLNSIIPQLNEDVEIVIVDGASQDNTPEAVAEYQKKSPHIHYHRLTTRGGIDKDMSISIDLASGEYCWLFSSDDVMKPDALINMLEMLDTKLDCYLCGADLCSLDIQEFLYKHRISSIEEEAVFNLSIREERLFYLQNALNLAALFGFMSSVIIKRSRWKETPIEEVFFGDCWTLAARIFRMIPNGLTMKYIPESYLRKRSFNDSFMDKGLVHRLGISINGYQKIADLIFGYHSEEARLIRQILRKEVNWKAIFIAHASVQSKEEDLILCLLVKKLFCDLPFLGLFISTLLVVCSPKCTHFAINSFKVIRNIIRLRFLKKMLHIAM